MTEFEMKPTIKPYMRNKNNSKQDCKPYPIISQVPFSSWGEYPPFP